MTRSSFVFSFDRLTTGPLAKIEATEAMLNAPVEEIIALTGLTTTEMLQTHHDVQKPVATPPAGCDPPAPAVWVKRR